MVFVLKEMFFLNMVVFFLLLLLFKIVCYDCVEMVFLILLSKFGMRLFVIKCLEYLNCVLNFFGVMIILIEFLIL